MTMRGIAFFSHAPLGGGGEGEGEGGEERRRKRRWGSLLACVFLLVAVACAKQALYETTLLAQALFFFGTGMCKTGFAGVADAPRADTSPVMF